MKRWTSLILISGIILLIFLQIGLPNYSSEKALLSVDLRLRQLKGETWRAEVRVRNLGSIAAKPPVHISLWQGKNGESPVLIKTFKRTEQIDADVAVAYNFRFKAKSGTEVFATAKANNSSKATSENIGMPIHWAVWVSLGITMIFLARRRRSIDTHLLQPAV